LGWRRARLSEVDWLVEDEGCTLLRPQLIARVVSALVLPLVS
jgi:hypothetical protein